MIKSFFTYIKENKRGRIALILLLLGVILVFFSTAPKKSDSAPEHSENSLEEYARELEERVEKLCSSVEGVGKCRVYITFSRGETSSYKGSALIESKPPKVQGVSVVCAGGDSPYVKSALTEMLCALFDVGTNRIAVMKLNS